MVQFRFHSWTWTASIRKRGAAEGPVRSRAIRERPYPPPDEVNSRNVNLMGQPNRALEFRQGAPPSASKIISFGARRKAHTFEVVENLRRSEAPSSMMTEI